MLHKTIEILDNTILQTVLGSSNKNLDFLSKHWNVILVYKDQKIFLSAHNKPTLNTMAIIFNKIQKDVKNNVTLDEWYFEKLLKFQSLEHQFELQTYLGKVVAKTPNQDKFISLMESKSVVFCSGVAGTGKTYLSVLYGVHLLKSGAVDRLIFSRPAVEAGENLGFLPGDLKDKVDPYMRPIYDSLYAGMEVEAVSKKIESKVIEIAPLAFMRGRTLSKAFVLLDEAQNTTPLQMEMFLTRLGAGTKMVIVGDLTQRDIQSGISGLESAMMILKNINDIGFIHLDSNNIVRHSIVTKIVDAYALHESKKIGRKTEL